MSWSGRQENTRGPKARGIALQGGNGMTGARRPTNDHASSSRYINDRGLPFHAAAAPLTQHCLHSPMYLPRSPVNSREEIPTSLVCSCNDIARSLPHHFARVAGPRRRPATAAFDGPWGERTRMTIDWQYFKSFKQTQANFYIATMLHSTMILLSGFCHSYSSYRLMNKMHAHAYTVSSRLAWVTCCRARLNISTSG